MKTIKITFALSVLFALSINFATAQETDNKLKLSGELLTDQRFLLKNNNDWAWNENRLSLKLEKKIKENSKYIIQSRL